METFSKGSMILAAALLLQSSVVEALSKTQVCEPAFFEDTGVAAMNREFDLWLVVRVFGDCEAERQVTVGRRGEKLEAFVLLPAAESTSSSSEASGEVDRLVRRDLSPEELQRVALLVDELESADFEIVPDGTLFLEGVHYTLWIGAGINLTKLSFHGPPNRRTARQDIDPLDAWIQELLRSLNIHCEPADL